MNEIQQNLSKLLRTFNDKRVITEGEIKTVFQVITVILAENKKGVDSLNAETKQQFETALNQIAVENTNLNASIRADLTKTQVQIEKATKDQNQRAFQQLQTLIAGIRLPKDGKDGEDGKDGIGEPGKDGSPDTAEVVRNKLETLRGEDRLDASAIKNLPKFIKDKAKDLLVGGIRFLEQLADISIVVSKKRQDLLIQFNNTNHRWQDGVALTVGTTAPSAPQENDLWVDTN